MAKEKKVPTVSELANELQMSATEVLILADRAGVSSVRYGYHAFLTKSAEKKIRETVRLERLRRGLIDENGKVSKH